MARARNIKPAFFSNELLGELEPIERLAFIAMWTIADFKGCFEFRPKRLRAQLMPYDDCDFEKITINLDKSGFVRIYSVQGQRYIKILNFSKHQNPHLNERKAGSGIPDLSENDNSNRELGSIQTNLDKDGTDPADSLIPHPSSLIPDSLIPKSEKQKHTHLAMLISLGIEDQIAKDWLAIRKAKRQPLTQTALESIQKKVAAAGLTMNEAIRICCERGWAGYDATWATPPLHQGKPAKFDPVAHVNQKRKPENEPIDITAQSVA